MSAPAAHLRLVPSDEGDCQREQIARAFRRTMIEHLRAHTEETNVNPETLLTTDYLNRFHEIVMLLELVPSAPEQFVPELAKWRPESYEEHFTRSGFRDKKLAVAGYQNAPEAVRAAFDDAVDDLQREIVKLLEQLREKYEAGDTEGLTSLCAEAVPHLHGLIQHAAAVVNGDSKTANAGQRDPGAAGAVQAEIDELFA